MEEPSAKRAKLEEPVDANSVVAFHLLRKVGGQIVMDEDGTFPPEMTHQLFGEEETIKGYEGLEIDVWLTPQFQAFVDVKCAGKAPGATDLAGPFREAWGEAGFFEKKADFDAALQAEPSLPLFGLGEQVAAADAPGGESRFLVFHSKLSEAGEAVKKLHARLEPLLLFFIDGASAIDPGDEGWELLLAVEQGPGGELDVVGLATLYSLWRFPEGSRLRVSQVLVLPPYQGRGVGAALLTGATEVADKRGAADLTFEDPTEQLQGLRDRLDLLRALVARWPREAAAAAIEAAGPGESGKGRAAAEAEAAADEGAAAAAGGSGSAAAGSDAAGAGGSSAAPAAAAPAPEQAAGIRPKRRQLDYPLAPPPELLSRLQSELRLSKGQALRIYEALVYLLAVPKGPEGEALVGSMLRGRMKAEIAAAERGGAGKVLHETEGGFELLRVGRGRQGSGPGTGGPMQLPAGAVEGVSAEEKAQAVEEAVTARLGAFKAACTSVAKHFPGVIG